LSLSYGLVKAHGGALTYEPPAEGGAEFRIVLPVYETATPVEPVAAATNGSAASRRILVVDEDPAVHRLISALFAPEGHAVEAVRSGEQALKLAQDGKYDMIIADNRLAAGAAEPFTTALLQSCPYARSRLVVACAGEEDQPASNASVRRVRKPLNPRDLRTMAQEIFNIPPRSPASTEAR
jgi:CheY-like chemotaxis protein